jgi:hypothetical protein
MWETFNHVKFNYLQRSTAGNATAVLGLRRFNNCLRNLTMIFFPKTRLALEIIGAMDEPISSATRSCLLSLLLYGAKQSRLLERQVGGSLSARESMLIVAKSIATNATAVAELCQVAALDFSQSIRVMMSLERATSTVAEMHGLGKLLNSVMSQRVV